MDISTIAIEWIIRQNDQKERKFVIRFRTKILTNKQMTYLQVKYEFYKSTYGIKDLEELFYWSKCDFRNKLSTITWHCK